MMTFKEFFFLESVVWRDSTSEDKKTATRLQFIQHAMQRLAERNVEENEMTHEELKDFYQRVIEKAKKDCKESTMEDPQPYLIYSLGLRQGLICVYQKGLFDYDGPNPHVFVTTWLPRGRREPRDPPGLKRRTKTFVIEQKEVNYIFLEID